MAPSPRPEPPNDIGDIITLEQLADVFEHESPTVA
jgi:hypothetical protein